MKRILCTLMVLILAWVASDALAQKTVTYTFKGRAKGYLLPAKPIDLVASGSKPAGVTISKIDGFVAPDDPDKDDNKIQDVDMDGFLGSALLTEYVVQPKTEAHIHFDGFRYEIADIKWNRCSEIAVLTSKGTTWATDWNETTIGSWTFSTEGEQGYSTSGELFYHTKPFLNSSAYNFTGLRTLNIRCESKQAQHGIAVKSFKIQYFEPVISFRGNDLTMEDIDGEHLTRTDNITAYISNHKGAFENVEIIFESSNPDITVSYSRADNKTTVDSNGEAMATVTAKANGRANIVAKIKASDGTVVAVANYTLKVGKQPDWYFERTTPIYSTTPNNTNFDSTKYPTLNSTNPANFVDTWADNPNGIFAQIEQQTVNNQQRTGVQPIFYHQAIPAYTNVTVKFDFTATLSKGSTSSGFLSSSNSANAGVELTEIGQTDEKDESDQEIAHYWPGTKSDHVFSTNTDNVYNVPTTDTRDFGSRSVTRTAPTYERTVVRAQGNNTSSVSDTMKDTYVFENSGEDTKGVTTGITGINKKQHLLALVFYKRRGIETNNVKIQGTFKYNSRKADYEYYAYVTFNGNGASNSMAVQTIHVTESDVEDNAKGTDATSPLNLCTLTRDGYIFVGWATSEARANHLDESGKADPIVDYVDEAGFCPCDAANGGGLGPVNLYACWKKAPTSTDPTDPENEDVDWLVYAVWGNGSTIVDPIDGKTKDHIENVFVTTQASPASFPKPAARTGYTFLGYYDYPVWNDPENPAVKVYDENGNRILDATTQEYYFSSNGNWKANADVQLYAAWKANTTGTLPPTPQAITFTLDGVAYAKFGLSGNSDQTRYVTKGESDHNNVNDLDPNRTSYKFAGWYTEQVGGTMLYNANGESVELESLSKDPVTGALTPSYRVMNANFFGENLKFVGNSPYNGPITLHAHWLPVGVEITFDEGPKASTQSATYTLSTAPSSHPGMDAAAYELTEYDVVNVKRTLKTNNWNTVCFPCDIYKEQVTKLFKTVKQFNSIEVSAEGDVVLKFKDVNIMAAGVPYFVQMKDGLSVTTGTSATDEAFVSAMTGDNVTEITVENVQVNKTPGTITVDDSAKGVEVKMIGSYTTEYHIGEGDTSGYDYYYLQDDKFYKSGGTYKVDGVDKTVWGNNQGFRVYFGVKASSLGLARLNMHLDLEGYDGWTGDGIEEILMDEVESNSNSAMYDLYGRRLNNLPKSGVYIMNGKKFIVK